MNREFPKEEIPMAIKHRRIVPSHQPSVKLKLHGDSVSSKSLRKYIKTNASEGMNRKEPFYNAGCLCNIEVSLGTVEINTKFPQNTKTRTLTWCRYTTRVFSQMSSSQPTTEILANQHLLQNQSQELRSRTLDVQNERNK